MELIIKLNINWSNNQQYFTPILSYKSYKKSWKLWLFSLEINLFSSDRYCSFFLLLFNWHFWSIGSIFCFEIILPILAVLVEILFKRKLRVHPFKCISQMIYIFIGPSWTKIILDQLKIIAIKYFSLLRIIYFKNLKSFHHLPRLYLVSTLCKDRWHYNLKIRTNRYQSAMIVIHVSMGEMLKWIFVALINQKKVLIVDIFIIF
jgi:hypothetical protein